MVYSYQEILVKYKNKHELAKAIKNKEIFKLVNNVYSDSNVVNPLIIYSKKYPSAVITMDSAFYYYNLTNVIPQKVYLATNRNPNKIQNSDIVQLFVPKDILYQGLEKIEINGNFVNMYNKERLLVELIRKKNQIPYDYYKEIILNYRYISNDLDMYKIEEYLSLYKNEFTLLSVLQNEVF